MKLAGLADVDVSCDFTWGKSSPALGVSFSLPPGILKSTVQNKVPFELLLQVNVTFPLSGTTYPPGIGSASADRVTVKAKRALQESHAMYRLFSHVNRIYVLLKVD